MPLISFFSLTDILIAESKLPGPNKHNNRVVQEGQQVLHSLIFSHADSNDSKIVWLGWKFSNCI